ncbi:hypothetical protein [Methyloraptor flagellatus]|uniref:Peptidoglycan-binding protein n=1 Tax=Methyloraptor flagellatus TaxID=3162530 RepID=A0AAU7X8N7_9HYPH
MRNAARRGAAARAETRSRSHDEPRSRSSYDEPRSSGFQQMEPHFRALAEKIDQIRKRDEDGLIRPVIDEIRSLRETVESRGKDADVDVGGELKRLGRLVERTAEAHGAGSVSIEPLVAEIGRLREVVLQSNVEGSLRSLEAGYGHIVERLDEMRRGTLDTRGIDQLGAEIAKIRDALGSVPKVNQISALERNLADIGRMLVRDHASVDPRIDDVSNRIDDLKRALGEANPSPALRSLEERLDLLTGKLDSVERSARGPVSPERMAGLVDELRIIAAGSRTADELRGLERRVAEIGERIADLGRRPGGPVGDAGALASRLDELSAKIDRIQPPSADHQLSLAALDATIDKVDRLIGRSRDGSITAVIEDRLAQLIGTLDRVERDHVGTNADVDALAREVAAMRREMVTATETPMRAMEAQMQTLAERLERSLADADDDRALEQIEDQLHRITQHLEQTQDRLGDMGAMERAIMRLEERLERRSDDVAAIAREVAEEMLRQRGGDHGTDRGDDPTLTALQADLKMLQNAARTNENRTIDTLQSLHGALVGIADRLNAIETGQNLFGQRGTAEPRPRFTNEPEPAVAAAPRRPEPVAVPTEDHRPLEPGSGKPAFTVADVEPPKEAPPNRLRRPPARPISSPPPAAPPRLRRLRAPSR